jgi:polyadenylate-binding protein
LVITSLMERQSKMKAQFGAVTSALISVDEEGKSRGFGFVNYERHDEVQKAVDALHDSEHYGYT